MGTCTIPVDLLNPGQVFACVGLMEISEILCGACVGGFDYRDFEPITTFTLTVDGSVDPVATAIRFLSSASVEALVPAGSDLSAQKWDVISRATSDTFPFPFPDSPATLPAILTDAHAHAIPIEHWGDDARKTGRDNVKFWAGAGGYPGVALARDAIALLPEATPEAIESLCADPFAFQAPQSSSFRFDWRRDYVPMDVGFSPNKHGSSISMVGYPLVELLAAIGLQHARPQRPDPRDKLAYRYSVSRAALPTVLMRATLGVQDLGFPLRRFRMRLGWPGKEDQARCIVDTVEETAHD
jgi:CRISPR-associated protein Csb3